MGQRERRYVLPGYSVRETGDRMNGGAVIEDKSPETEAILHIAAC